MIPFNLHDGNPTDALKAKQYSKQLRADFKKGIFEDLIEKYILNNQHKVVLKFTPEEGYMDKETAAEESVLKNLETLLTEDDRLNIMKEGLELKKDQEQI